MSVCPSAVRRRVLVLLLSLLEEQRCYRKVGCFHREDPDRLTHPLVLPMRPRKIRTKMHIYSRRNGKTGKRISGLLHFRKKMASFFEDPKPLIVLVHGYTQSLNSSWLHEAKEALLHEMDCNVIIVDWSKGCMSPKYFSSVGNTALVGRQISLLLQRLLRLFPQTLLPEMVHLVGFSLGAQVCGFCGRHFKKETRSLLGRITALDAARPMFEKTNVHVSRRDAQFVDAIHTSSGWTVLQKAMGMSKPFAHVDFYPNGGRDQPGCDHVFDFSCDHGRAPEFFIESLKDRSECKFLSYSCKGGKKSFRAGSCLPGPPEEEMGYYSFRYPGRGLQFLRTNKKPPFCIPYEYELDR
ncbi:hypothetical protein HPB47_002312 [Ixodes persulcatus]|uniref:Uncharacterized protein n=1 Tax=Ixodes persulcatus TaxID=34615 RepID=A0AC60PMS6_IXOPE|nr:hypothetical protein HPB47_002312 [Ixodes persulcatus]